MGTNINIRTFLILVIMKSKRSIPYFKALLKAKQSKRMNILQSFPSFVIDDLLEVLYNVVLGRVNLSAPKRKMLKRHQKPLLDLVNTKNKKLMRKIIYTQSGGFIGAILPIVLSALGGFIAKKLE